MAALEAHVAVGGPQRHRLQVLNQHQVDLVEVGQLVARRVYRVEVRVPLLDPLLALAGVDGLPGVQNRKVHVLVVVDLQLHQLDPVLHPRLGNGGVHLGLVAVVRMELLQVVAGRVEAPEPVREQTGAKAAVDEGVVGVVPRVLDGLAVHHLDGGGVLGDGALPLAREHRGVLLVQLEGFPRPLEVLGVEWVPIRELVVLAQGNGQRASSVGELDVLGEPGDPGLAVAVPRYQGVSPYVGVVARPGVEPVPGPAILADGDWRYYERVLRQPVLDGRQLTRLHLGRESRRLVERRGHRHGDRVLHHSVLIGAGNGRLRHRLFGSLGLWSCRRGRLGSRGCRGRRLLGGGRLHRLAGLLLFVSAAAGKDAKQQQCENWNNENS